MSLALPCHSDFDLLAGPAAVDMNVKRNLCSAVCMVALYDTVCLLSARAACALGVLGSPLMQCELSVHRLPGSQVVGSFHHHLHF